MGAQVNAPVYVGGRFFDAGAEVPDELLDLVGDHLFDGGKPVAAVEVPEKPNGRSSEEKWAEYAEALGLDVPDDADKAAIRALVDEHEKAQEAAASADSTGDEKGGTAEGDNGTDQ